MKHYTVSILKSLNFRSLPLEEKLRIKSAGRPTKRWSTIEQQTNKYFFSTVYKNEWVCGCYESKRFFCFPCLLYGGVKVWAKDGVVETHDILDSIKEHSDSLAHISNALELGLLGRANCGQQIDDDSSRGVQVHNQQVKRNRDVLPTLIDCVLFEIDSGCKSDKEGGAFGVAVEFAARLDPAMKAYLGSTTTSSLEAIREDLLDCMLEVCRQHIIEQIHQAGYFAVTVEDISDLSERRLAIVYRYERDGRSIERFWGFCQAPSPDAAAISSCLIKELRKQRCDKLVAQSFDAVCLSAGVVGDVQRTILETYAHACPVHSHAHCLHMGLERVASQVPKFRLFSLSLNEISKLLSRSPSFSQWSEQAGCPVSSFNVRMLFENRDAFIRRCEAVLATPTSRDATVAAAASSLTTIRDFEFSFFLAFGYLLTPHVSTLADQLGASGRQLGETRGAVCAFIHAVETLGWSLYDAQKGAKRDDHHPVKHEYNAATNVKHENGVKCEYNAEIAPPAEKKSRLREQSVDASTSCSHNDVEENENSLRAQVGRLPSEEMTTAARDVCNALAEYARTHFDLLVHVDAVSLVDPSRFTSHALRFPGETFDATCVFYSGLVDRPRLSNELLVLYVRADLPDADAGHLLRYLVAHGLEASFAETVKLARILIATPTGPRGTPSTSAKVRAFLEVAPARDRLDALAMLTLERNLVAEVDDFNGRVTTRFTGLPRRQADFVYKTPSGQPGAMRCYCGQLNATRIDYSTPFDTS